MTPLLPTLALLALTLAPARDGDRSIPGTKVIVIEDGTKVKVTRQPPPPPYPEKAAAARIEGDVVVQITIDGQGVPSLAQALEGPKELRTTAEAYVMQWRFQPVLLNGKAQYARFKLTIPFKLPPKH